MITEIFLDDKYIVYHCKLVMFSDNINFVEFNASFMISDVIEWKDKYWGFPIGYNYFYNIINPLYFVILE